MTRAGSRGIAIGLGSVALAALIGTWAFWPRPRPGSEPPAEGVARAVSAPASDLAAAIRGGDGRSLTAAHKRLTTRPDAPLPPPTGREVAEWTELVEACRVAYTRFPGAGKTAILEAAAAVLDRLTVEGTPSESWPALLPPAHDLFAAGLRDADPGTRTMALRAVGHLWAWAPGCAMTGPQEGQVGAWKASFYDEILRRLEDPDLAVRLQAIACLGSLPIDAKAAPAAALRDDPDFRVRTQVLTSFAMRPGVLSEEAILPLLHDPLPDLRGLAEKVLKARGLSAELIGLGEMVTHARPEIRASAIPLLLQRDDIDPTVWLLRLSEDGDESVRLAAVEAFAGKGSPEVLQRLRELAAADESEAVRLAASKLLPKVGPTAALPPLPGSPRLTPRAN